MCVGWALYCRVGLNYREVSDKYPSNNMTLYRIGTIILLHAESNSQGSLLNISTVTLTMISAPEVSVHHGSAMVWIWFEDVSQGFLCRNLIPVVCGMKVGS